MGSGSYSKLKAQRTNDDIYMGLHLPHHSNRQKGKLQARNQTKNERFMATPNFSKEKLLCLAWAGGAGEEVWGAGGTTIVFIQKAKYFLRENAHLSALRLRSEHLDTSTFHKLNKTPTTVHQIKLKGLHRVCAVWNPPSTHITHSQWPGVVSAASCWLSLPMPAAYLKHCTTAIEKPPLLVCIPVFFFLLIQLTCHQ